MFSTKCVKERWERKINHVNLQVYHLLTELYLSRQCS